MLDLLKAAILGVIQGLTEFLPISSSGHLILARDLLGWRMLADAHLNKVFDVALHAGTFLALVIYFWADIVRLVKASAASLRYGIRDDPARRMAWMIVVATLPAAAAGVVGEDVIERTLGAPTLIAIQLIIFGFVLWGAEWLGRKRRALADTNWGDAIVVGVAQAVALSPGVSRSGITITGGLLRGLTREAAARLSFLISIPTVGGTAAYSFLKLAKDHVALPPGSVGMFVVGMLFAALSGYLCIRYFLRYLQTRSLAPFILYRILFGVAMLVGFRVVRLP